MDYNIRTLRRFVTVVAHNVPLRRKTTITRVENEVIIGDYMHLYKHQ